MTTGLPATEAYVNNYAIQVSRIFTEFARERFNLPADWTPVVRLDFNPRRKRSWGGRRRVGGRGNPVVPFMSLVLGRYLGGVETTFTEYKRFENDPVIGTFRGERWENALACLIAHELAHAVQYTITDSKIIEELGGRKRGHGAFWQNIYAIFRKRFINDGHIPLASFLYAGEKVMLHERGDHCFVPPLKKVQEEGKIELTMLKVKEWVDQVVFTE